MRKSTLIKMINNPSILLRAVVSSGAFNWLPDKPYLRLKWKINMGGHLNLDSPRTFNEKIQWLKLNDRKEVYHLVVDKYEAKIWAKSVIGEEHIIPTYGVWNRFDEIDFSSLPDQFVLKCTHDSGGLVVCRDKSNLDLFEARKKIEDSLSRQYYYVGREWPYKNIKARIIAEKFMSDDRTEESGLTDFKFFCFNGEPRFLYISQGLENHETAGISFYGLDGKKLNFKRDDYREIPGDHFDLPECFNDMVTISQRLACSLGSPFVRVDLYEINGEIFFSEMTFSPCSGYLPFEPKEADQAIGDLLVLSK